MPTKRGKETRAESRSRIIAAASKVTADIGLTDWTVERVAHEAGCAKGLVLYHFGSKQALLDQVAIAVTTERLASRAAALRLPPAKAIDQLWVDLAREVGSGAFRLWLALAAATSTSSSATFSAAQRQQLATAAAATFRLPASDPALTALPAVLDGFQLLLLQGVPEPEVREAFDSYWLEVLSRAG